MNQGNLDLEDSFIQLFAFQSLCPNLLFLAENQTFQPSLPRTLMIESNSINPRGNSNCLISLTVGLTIVPF